MAWASLVTNNAGKPVCLMASIADITDRKQMEKALEESHHDLNRAQVVALTGSWRLDVQRNELLWSDENHRIFGIPKGTPMTYETFLSTVHPEDREYVDRKWAAAGMQGEPYDIEHRIIVGKEVRWVREKAELEFDDKGILKDGFGTSQDITDRKKAEAELAHLASFPELNPNPILELDIAGNLKYINPAAKTLFPDLAKQGKKHPFFLSWEAIADKLQSGKLTYLIREIETDDSWYEQMIIRVPSSENYRIYIRDITEHKKAEVIKDEFIGLISHELRTPLTIISGSLRVARNEGLSTEEINEMVQNAAESTDTLSDILENMLEMSRHQAGKLQLNTERINIRNIATQVVDGFKASGTSQRFLIEMPETLPLIQADPLRVERIFHNLVENAVKYSPEDSEIGLVAHPESGYMITEVIDQGKGIPEKIRRKLFSMFERGDNRGVTGGTGLGLVVCKRLVEAHGGWIKAESSLGKGSTFTFGLPLYPGSP